MVNTLPAETPASFVNILGFHYAVIETDAKGAPTKYKPISHVRGSQEIKVDLDTEVIENWGDGEVQEMAVSTGKAKLDFQAFAIPLAQRAELLGMEIDSDGNVIRRRTLNPPNVGVIFAKEKANGDLEVVALTRGMFSGGGHDGKTSEEKKAFGNQSVGAEFSSRFSDEIAEVNRLVKKGDTAGLNKIYQLVFGYDAPTTAIPWNTVVTEPSTLPAG
ncbi:major tail protein [Macrococcus bovicus]|uniref:major tail protein n=1 Tax=Macrococcus bovicus TaxID=69968 RepID=UPI0025A57BD6|nr:major tail protein [Macrococcus bovicus]WJP97064.1 hypothetical protein QSV55_07200 [Macrococcus bovicus]